MCVCVTALPNQRHPAHPGPFSFREVTPCVQSPPYAENPTPFSPCVSPLCAAVRPYRPGFPPAGGSPVPLLVQCRLCCWCASRRYMEATSEAGDWGRLVHEQASSASETACSNNVVRKGTVSCSFRWLIPHAWYQPTLPVLNTAVVATSLVLLRIPMIPYVHHQTGVVCLCSTVCVRC